MQRLPSRSMLLVLVFAGLAIAVSAGTCDPETSTLKPLFQTPAAQFSFQGARIVIQPWRKFGVPDPELSMKLDMRRLAEVARNSTGCPVPGIVSFVSDPDTPVTRELLIANCDCDFSWRNKTIQAGIHEEQLAIEVDCSNVDQALYGNLGLQIYFKRPNGNYSYHYDPAITSQNKTIDLGYRAGEVSFAMDVQNWPWDPQNGRSYVLADFRAYPSVGGSVNVTSGSDGIEGYVSMTSKYSKTILYAPHSYVLDGEPYLPSLAVIDEEHLPIVGGLQNIWFDIRQQLCTEVFVSKPGAPFPDIYTANVKWTNSSYDPTFVTLFSDFNEGPQSPQVNSVRLAVGITLGVLAAIIVIVVVTVPVVKYVVRPYARRADQKHQNNELLQPSKPGWSTGTKPSSI